MNCPSRTDETLEHDGWNQNPPALAAELTTRSDLNGIANTRLQRDQEVMEDHVLDKGLERELDDPLGSRLISSAFPKPEHSTGASQGAMYMQRLRMTDGISLCGNDSGFSTHSRTLLRRFGQILLKFSKFIGPGFMVSVAYIDPGNYATDVAAGASTRFKLLFIVLMSNLFAIVLQSLAIRLGTVTGLNLAEHCRLYLPKWLNIFLYILAEAAIIVTDIAEVIGSAIALNLLLKVPLVAGCALTLVDVLLILFFYNPSGSMKRLRAFEYFVMALVLAVVVCFCIQLSFITNTSVGEVFAGYLPSSAIVDESGLYLSCGILGATVMPHSLYLGSGMVQPRLREFDSQAELQPSGSAILAPSIGADATHQVLEPSANHQIVNLTSINDSGKTLYRPSLAAIKSCLNYSVTELALSLSIFALFVNSAILIVAGASLSNNPSAPTADLFGIHDLLSSSLAPAAGTIFAIALLISGMSAGIICTIAGQMVSEGALNWSIAPWLRRLITRCISITPSIIIAGAVGREGLSAALNGSQVALSVILPFVSAPLVYFTCRNKYMTVGGTASRRGDGEAPALEQDVGMKSHWVISSIAVAVWLLITIMNVALLVLLGLGEA